MHEQQSSGFKEAYPYLADEFARQDSHDLSQSRDVYDQEDNLLFEGLSHTEAMRILRAAKMPHVKVTPTKMGGDSYLEFL